MTTLARGPRATLLLLSLALVALPAFASPPKLSAKINDLIERFFSPPEFEAMKLSPTGSHVAFFKESNGRFVLATYNFKTTKLKLTDPAPGQRVDEFHWVGPNHILFDFIQDSYKQDRPLDLDPRYNAIDLENVYLGHWLADADLTRTSEIPNLGPIYEVVDPLPQDATRALLAQQSSDNFYSPLYRLDPSRNKVDLLERNPGKVIGWHTDTAGQVRLATVAESGGATSLIYRETEKTDWKPLPLPANAVFITFDASGQRLLVSFADSSGRYVLGTFDLATGKLTDATLTDPTYDVTPSVIRDPRTGAARGLSFHGEKLKTLWLDPQFKQVQASLAPALPGMIVQPVGLTQSGEILVHTYSDVSPSEYYLFNPQANKLQLFLDRSPKVRDLALAPMKPIAFKTAEGVELHGYLTRPPGDSGRKPLPLIVLIHGGPALRDTWGYDAEVQYFAALGYAVLQVNYRGSSGYGTEFAQKDITEVGIHSVDDIAASLKWAVSEGIADPKRLVVCGGSYGGFIALGIATRYPELPAAVIGFAGVYDWESHSRASRERFDQFYGWDSKFYPDPKKNPVPYHNISPVHVAGAVKAPVLLIHGRRDRRVDIAQSERMADALRKAGKSVEIVKDAEGVHGLPDVALRRKYYETVTAFLLKYAPPDTAP